MKTQERKSQRDDYIRLRTDGAYSGNKRQITWSHEKAMHTCCNSKHSRYHRTGCVYRVKRAPTLDDFSEDDLLKKRIRGLRSEGFTSEEVLGILLSQGEEITLAKVNKLYA